MWRTLKNLSQPVSRLFHGLSDTQVRTRHLNISALLFFSSFFSHSPFFHQRLLRGLLRWAHTGRGSIPRLRCTRASERPSAALLQRWSTTRSTTADASCKTVSKRYKGAAGSYTSTRWHEFEVPRDSSGSFHDSLSQDWSWARWFLLYKRNYSWWFLIKGTGRWIWTFCRIGSLVAIFLRVRSGMFFCKFIASNANIHYQCTSTSCCVLWPRIIVQLPRYDHSDDAIFRE